LGFPTDLIPPNLALNTFLVTRVPSILWTCPVHWSLFSWYMLQGQVHHTVHTIPCCISSSTDRYPELDRRLSLISSFQKLHVSHSCLILSVWNIIRAGCRRRLPSVVMACNFSSLLLGKFTPAKLSKAWRERKYSSYSFTTSALDGGEWSASRFGRTLPTAKGPPVPIEQEAGWAPEPVWTHRLEEKSFDSAGNRTSIALSSSP
jgi:hypothetical protein